ncbi:hypothetical protein [Synechococcus elongatus]|uniref:hypothetical protein n=1 Tax=Synechococcus elongatus TaxID=32046 RepID=UPI000F7F7AE4|nr:hypothetical protein [Synechococcus elongatus]
MDSSLLKRSLAAIAWLSLVSYTALLAPPDDPQTWDLIRRLSLGQWQGINPLIVALFNAMGLWPLLYGPLLLLDGHQRGWRAWPFAIASFGAGAFALLPYFVFRPLPTGSLPVTWPPLLQKLDRRWLTLPLGIAIALLGLLALQGDLADFVQQFQTSRFIQVMTLDFACLTLLFPVLLLEDAHRRGDRRRIWPLIGFLPLLGAVIYQGWRLPLPKAKSLSASDEATAAAIS